MFVERVEVVDGNVFHVSECDACQGYGWTYQRAWPGARAQLQTECDECEGAGEHWDDTCTKPCCMAVLAELYGEDAVANCDTEVANG
jgi:hypothetical protein